jgi:hypothetical protein
MLQIEASRDSEHTTKQRQTLTKFSDCPLLTCPTAHNQTFPPLELVADELTSACSGYNSANIITILFSR